LNLTGDAYPNDPILTLSGGSWSGGKYLIDPSQALTITTNAFSGYGSHPDDIVRLAVEGITDIFQFHSDVPGTNFLTFTVPAFSFTGGQEYHAAGVFDALVDVNPKAALPDSINAAFYEVATILVIRAVPEPSTYAVLLAGLGLIGFATRRRLKSSRVRWTTPQV